MVGWKRGAAAALVGMALAFGASAQTTLAGARFEPEVSLGSQKLQLNGAGVRFKTVIKVYAAGLYTPRKVTRAEDVLNPQLPKRLQLVALRDISGDDFGRLFSRAIEENTTRQEFSHAIGAVIRMGQIFADVHQFSKGETVLVDYVPGQGLAISYRGKQQGEMFREPEFSAMMFKIWFGPKPADSTLEKALLGEQNYANINLG
ncbi:MULTISPECIES: chalcone isomerase family protein [Ramlibacter]|uniref:Chalcone isomerase family protein n=1 Tax=Ramlibacter aquaticus TaxID=2780094 RepID=A0ABR9SDH6_9BURK|nr:MULTISPECIES: chalcone isomerase family protein [Ramlibacter]MBE7940405.1 chalcone isomerase family protein [Ramlibacter aquaticus]